MLNYAIILSAYKTTYVFQSQLLVEWIYTPEEAIVDIDAAIAKTKKKSKRRYKLDALQKEL